MNTRDVSDCLNIQECIGLAQFIAMTKFPKTSFSKEFLIDAAVESRVLVTEAAQSAMRNSAENSVILTAQRDPITGRVPTTKALLEEYLTSELTDAITARLRIKAAAIARARVAAQAAPIALRH